MYEKGYYEYMNGDLNKSIELFNNSIRKKENVANSFLYRSAAQIFLSRYEDAENGLDTVKHIDSLTPKLNYYYGKLYVFLGQYEKAINFFNAELFKNPTNAAAYVDRGNAKSFSGDLQGALEDANKAIGIDSEKQIYYNNRGYTLLKMKRYMEAISDFSISLKKEANQKAYSNRGFAYSLINLDTLAIDDYTNALKIVPNDAETLCLRGISLKKIGKRDEACNDFKKSANLGYIASKEMIEELKCN